jgi:hypothetical protein
MKRLAAVLAVTALGAVTTVLWTGQALAGAPSPTTPREAPPALGAAHPTAVTYAINGSVLQYGGEPVSGAGVFWGWFTPTSFRSAWHQGGRATTGSPGTFAFGTVTAHPANDALFAYYNPATTGVWQMELWNLDFSTQASFPLRPGRVAVTISHAPKGANIADIEARGTPGLADTRMALASGKGVAAVVPPGFNDLIAWFAPQAARYQSEMTTGKRIAESEWQSPGNVQVSVAAGATAATTVPLDWNQALRASLAGPACRHSGPPGSVPAMVVRGWPAGEQASFYGFSLSGAGAVQTYTAQVNSTGASKTYTVPLAVPKTATVGEIYEMDTWRSDDTTSLVGLWDYFQVCTFKASASRIARGGGVRLSGHVPGSGYVELFTRRSAAGQPSTLKARGWTPVGRYLLKNGKFVTKAIHLRHAAWFVARYPGQKGEYFSAFTGVVKVAVH